MDGVPGLAGLILCGGRSSRMGTEKALLRFDGEALVLRVARRMGAVASPVLLAPGLHGRLGSLGYDEVDDAVEGSGPLGGLVAGLGASPHPLVAVAAADMPFVSPQLLALLARLTGDLDAAIPVTGQGLEPLHAVYSVRALPALREALRSGVLAMRDVASQVLQVRRVEQKEWRTAEPAGRFAINVNRPEDWFRLIERSHTKEGNHGRG
jgi:molybdopterin-guanine dinucleotide biosynthesis protein A